MRYSSDQNGLLNSEHYKQYLKERGLKHAIIQTTFSFNGLKDVEIQVSNYGYWNVASSLHKISQELYGTIEYWWTIALVNSKPTDAHFSLGDEIVVPVRPEVIKNVTGGFNGY